MSVYCVRKANDKFNGDLHVGRVRQDSILDRLVKNASSVHTVKLFCRIEQINYQHQDVHYVGTAGITPHLMQIRVIDVRIIEFPTWMERRVTIALLHNIQYMNLLHHHHHV